ncbi:MAG: hypothetical protein ACI8V2_004792 [Candidatus Latescibacterota bacterium]|jgi:hypothetical protein
MGKVKILTTTIAVGWLRRVCCLLNIKENVGEARVKWGFEKTCEAGWNCIRWQGSLTINGKCG